MISSMLGFDEITALVIGLHDLVDRTASPLPGLREDMRLAKAGALYADKVALASFCGARAIAGLTGDWGTATGVPGASIDPQVRAEAQRAFAALVEDATDDDERTLEDFAKGLKINAFWLPTSIESGLVTGVCMAGRRSADILPLYGARTHAALVSLPALIAAYITGPDGERMLGRLDVAAAKATSDTSRSMLEGMAREVRAQRSGVAPMPQPKPHFGAEGRLLTGTLGGLRSFPDAEWDVILDVRQRLLPSRTRFRATISQASAELENASEDELVAACEGLRRRIVAPALADIEEELDDLGAIPTLLRVAKDGPTVGTVAANLALAASDAASLGIGIGILAHGVASAPLIASAVREAAHQRSKRRSLAAQPYWILREIARNSKR